MKFNPGLFPNYKLLSPIERLFLRTCCYYPPRSRRIISPDDINESGKYKSIYESAFGSELWALIESKSVVDLGCGQGGFVLSLGIQGAGLVIGVDIQNLFLHAIQKAQKEDIDNVFFFQGELAAMADNSVDIVISHDSFEHFHDPQAVLEEMVRVLRPGGSLLIKFGPPWRNPWGRHMSGTVRKDRPWVHLVFPERTIMRCHSVYHNFQEIHEKYEQLPGGLNKMTVHRFKQMLLCVPELIIESIKVNTLFTNHSLLSLPIIIEFFASSVSVKCKKKFRMD